MVISPVVVLESAPMKFNAERHHRRSIRLPGYDYSRIGSYFITVCSHERLCLFGDVVNGEMRLSPAGTTVAECWKDLPKHYPHVVLDEFVVMPNHVHGILALRELAPSADARRHGVAEVIRAFKTYSARRINMKRKTPGVPIWQRNYHERVLRNEDELAGIRRYIIENPAKWDWDRENPICLA